MLRHTIIWPAGSVAGFGEKDCAPFCKTISTVTTPPGAVGVGAGVGAGVGVGVTGFPSVALPQPHAHRVSAAIMAPTITRISSSFLLLLGDAEPPCIGGELADEGTEPSRYL